MKLFQSISIMSTDKHIRAIGAFVKHKDIQLALRGLKDAGFPLNKLSVIAQDAREENNIAGVNFKEHIDNKVDGGTVVELTEMLLDLGILVIPGVGPIMLAGNIGSIMLAGAEAKAIANPFSRGTITTTTRGLTAALIALGIPDDKAKIYSDLVNKGYYLLIVNGEDRNFAITSRKPLLVIAEMICRNHGVKNWDVYNISAANSTSLNKRYRYQYAAGLFFLYRDLENGLDELRRIGFPMEQVTVVAKSTAKLSYITYAKITAPQYNFGAFEIPDDIAKHYNYRVLLGDYLLLLSGTAIQLAAAQNILEKYQIQNYATFRPYLGNSTTVSKNY